MWLVVFCALLAFTEAQNRLYPCTCCDSLVGRIRRTGCRFFCDRDKDGNGLVTQLELFALVDELALPGENYIRKNRFIEYATSTLNFSTVEADRFYDRLAKKNTIEGNPTVVEKVDMRVFSDTSESTIGSRAITETLFTQLWSEYYSVIHDTTCDAFDVPSFLPNDPVLRERYLLDGDYRRRYLADPALENLDPYYYSEARDPFYTYRAKGYIKDVDGRGVLDSKYRRSPVVDRSYYSRGESTSYGRGRDTGYRGESRDLRRNSRYEGGRGGRRYSTRRSRESYSSDYYNRGTKS